MTGRAARRGALRRQCSSQAGEDPAWQLGQTIGDRFDSTLGHDDFTQPGNLHRLFDEGQRDRLTTPIAAGLGQARREVQLRQLCNFFRADPEYGQRVAAKLGIDISQFQTPEGVEAAAAG
jgi:catalase